MNAPTNLLDQPVREGDFVAVTTTSGKWSRTRIAKVERIVNVPSTRYDHTTKTQVIVDRHRVFVKLYKRVRDYNRIDREYGPFYLKAYVKEIFGITSSVPVDMTLISQEIYEVLK